MAGRGFIHDKLDIKFLILYITARIIEPVPFNTILELALCDEGVDYFDFSECMRDLVDSAHLTLSEDGLYAITDKGLRNSEICESSLPYSVRLRCDRDLDVWNRKLRRKHQVRACSEKRENGTYTVHMSLDDDLGNIMDLKLMAVQENMAQAFMDHFQKNPERIFTEVMKLMLSEPSDDTDAR